MCRKDVHKNVEIDRYAQYANINIHTYIKYIHAYSCIEI